MIKKFVDRCIAAQSSIEAEFRAKRPDGYDVLVKRVVELIAASADEDSEYGQIPDPKRIHIIDDGDYQGTRLYVIAAKGYQPSTYWSIFVDYGSCSGCDTFAAIDGAYGDEPPSTKAVRDYWTLMLHIVQGMRKLGEPEADPAVAGTD